MAVEATELLLVHLYGLADGQRAQAWVRGPEFRAGAAPQESLDDFEVTASVETTRPNRGCLSADFASAVECRVGTVKVRLVVEHDIETVRPRVADIGDPDEVLGDAGSRFYGSGYAARRQVIDDVRRDGEMGVSARVRVGGWDRDGELSADLGAAYRPSVSSLDTMTAQPQMAQALPYHLDGFDREGSHTLWMRCASVAATTPYRPVEGAFTATAGVVKTRLTAMGGATFRSSDFVGAFQGIACSYSLAHQLPDRVARELTATSSQKG